MYVSKYYTCEEIDQRLLQGYYDDFVTAGFAGTLNEFWAFVLSIKNKVDKKEGYDLSKNDFTDELKRKLDGIEEKANYITKVSQLENDSKFQTEEEVKKMIDDLVDGAGDALDTLKELAEALGNDPNFATNITNKLTDLRNDLTAEVNRAKEKEAELGSQITAVNDALLKAVDLLKEKIDNTRIALVDKIDKLEAKVDKNTADIADLRNETTGSLADAKAYAKDLVDKEAEARKAGDDKLVEDMHQMTTLHIRDKAELTQKIAEEAQLRENQDAGIRQSLTEEITNRQTGDAALESKLSDEVVNRKAADETLQNGLTKEVADRTNADNTLQTNIDKEAQARESGDQVLKGQIDSEAATRTAQDQILDQKITALSDRTNADKGEVLAAVEAEKEARIAGDADLNSKKVDKREGYSLTKNDFTDLLLAKLNGIEEHANYITLVSQLANDAGYQTEAEVEAAIQKIIGSAPEVLDTLEEIAKALGDDPNFASTITKKLAAITEKVNQEIEDREAADVALQANITDEETARIEADAALKEELKEYVDNSAATGNTALQVVKDNLAKEIQDRKDADATLQANINKEATDRKAADATHTENIATLNQRVSDLALSIQDAINTVKNELTAQVNANTTAIATNAANIQKNSEAITAVTKTVGDNYKEVKDMINEEIVDRTNGDSNLSSRIDNTNIALGTEQAERKAADQILQVNLDKEVGDRKSADAALETKIEGQISGLNQTISGEITRVEGKVTQEIKDREAANKTLSDRINSLETGSNEKVNELKTKVEANTAAINVEKERAIAKEDAIQANLNTAIANHKDEVNALTKSISDEANVRISGDAALQVNIDKEVTDRKNADTLINNALAQEVSDRTTAIQGLESKKVDKVDGKVLSSNDFTDLLLVKLNGIQEKANYITKVSELLNDSGFQTAEQVEAAIQKIIGSAPEVLDTLKEIADALGNDPNFATTMTQKLTELTAKIETETQNRVSGDAALDTKLTTLDTKLTKIVEDLRTYVTETRTELLARANNQDALITQNAANIQRNLELIQGIQNNNSGSYLEVKALLETEIAARKAEITRVEGLITDTNQALTTETEERKAADKVLQDNLDAEEAARIAADNALGVRIDTETSERKAADTNLDNKINKEIQDRTTADTALQTKLDKEVSDRTTADTELGTRIDNEEDAREAADTTLQENIDTEETERKAADNTLQGNIDATNAHTINTHRLDSNPVLNGTDIKLDGYEKNAGNTPADLDIKSTDTTSAAFGKVQKRIEVDKSDASSKFNKVKTAVGLTNDLGMPVLTDTNYMGDSVDVVDSLKKLDTQIKASSDSDALELARVETKLNKEISDRIAGDAALKTELTGNINDAKTELQDNLDAEEAARIAADTALKTELTGNTQEVLEALNEFIATKAQANGLASLDGNGKVPANQLPSYVDDVIDVYATYEVSATGEISNIALYSDAAHQTPIVGESGKSYIDITPNQPGYQFRWSGTTWVPIISSGLILGEITGTAYDGLKGKVTKQKVDEIEEFDPCRIGTVSASTNSIGINYRNLSTKETLSPQIILPAVTNKLAGVMTAADKIKLDTTLPNQITDSIAQEVEDRNEAIATAKTSLTTSLNKEVNDRKAEITRVEGLISDEAATRAQADTNVNAKVDSHIANKSNPHGVTKAQVGLGNVNNTSDVDKPVSTAQATAIAEAKAAGTNAQANLNTHTQNKSNPHNVTRDQLGMGTNSEIVFKKVSAPSGLWKESDERLKSFIKPLEHTLDEICSIPTDSFIIRGSHDIGTIAQAIEKHFPELVSENTVKSDTVPNPEVFETIEKDGETYVVVKEVDYSKMSVLAIEGIKLLKARIEELEKKLLFTNLD